MFSNWGCDDNVSSAFHSCPIHPFLCLASRTKSTKQGGSTIGGAPCPLPDVIVDFVFEDGLFFLAVTNIGSEPAERVRIVFDPLVKGPGGSVSVTELPLFRNLEFLGPRTLDPHPSGSASAYFARCEPERITVNVSYCDRAGQNFKTAIFPGLSIYRDIAFY